MGTTPDTLADRSSPDTPQTVTPQHQTNNGGPYGEDLFSATTRVPVRAKSPQSPVTDDEAHRQGTVRRDWVRLGVEISALFVGLAGIYGLFVTFKETRKSTDAATRAAVAAERAGIATAAQVKVAQDTLQFTVENNRLDQRAWLGIASHNMSPKPPDTTNPIFMSTVIKNTGKTPAKKVWAYSETTSSLEHGQRQPDFSQDRDKTRSRGIVPPGGEVHSEVSLGRDAQENRILPNQEIIDDLKNNRVRMYVHGFVSYQDIFNKCHWLTFCFYLVAPDLSSFSPCEDYNDTGDEQCKEEYPQ